MKRIHAMFAVLLAFVLIAPAAARAQFGSQPVRMLYGFAPGSTGDALARIVAEDLQRELGQNVIVENRPGASGKLALRALKGAAPDGLTLYIGPSGPMTIIPLHDMAAGYDPLTDFVAISQLVTFDFALVAGPATPARNLPELVAWLKANPGKGSFGTSGPGTSMHFLGLRVAQVAGVDLRPVHFRGAALALGEVVSGQMPMAILPLSDSAELNRAGAVRVLATSNRERSIFLPEAPTFIEQGLDVQAWGWYAAYAPANTPAPVVERLNKIMAAAMRKPEIRDRLQGMGFQTTGTTPGEIAEIQQRELDFWRPVVKTSGFKSED